jgi:N utilization substance protein B
VARRKGRILAVQALYSWDAAAIPVGELCEFSWVEQEKVEKMGEDGVTFARLLINGTLDHIDEVDNIIRLHLTGWDFTRINKVDLSILRMSVYTMLFQKDIHPSIVIDEAIDISKEFGNDDSFKFINGVLDSIRRTSLEA